MGLVTAIEWCDSTVNPVMGCDGCELWAPRLGIPICYAGLVTERMLRDGPKKGWPEVFGKPALFPWRLDEAARWKDLTGTRRPDKPWLDGLPRLIFVVDMGDGFTASVNPDDWLTPKLGLIAASPHRWLLLTKRIDRLAEYADRHELPPNVWAGVSVTSPQDARVRALKQVRAALRFASLEPILKPVDVAGWFPGVDWVIVGGASGETPTEVEAIRRVIAVCRDAKVPLFVKQLGTWPVIEAATESGPEVLRRQSLIDGEWPRGTHFGNPTGLRILNGRVALVRDPKGGDWSEWPEDLRVREMPR
jgi:protein gp37